MPLYTYTLAYGESFGPGYSSLSSRCCSTLPSPTSWWKSTQTGGLLRDRSPRLHLVPRAEGGRHRQFIMRVKINFHLLPRCGTPPFPVPLLECSTTGDTFLLSRPQIKVDCQVCFL